MTPEEIKKGLRSMAHDTSIGTQHLKREKKVCAEAVDLIEDLQKKPPVKKDTLITNE